MNCEFFFVTLYFSSEIVLTHLYCVFIKLMNDYFWLYVHFRFVGSYLQIKEHYKRSAAQAAKYKDLPIIQINASFNNTVITLSDPKGLVTKVISYFFWSGGLNHNNSCLELNQCLLSYVTGKTLGWVSAVSNGRSTFLYFQSIL